MGLCGQYQYQQFEIEKIKRSRAAEKSQYRQRQQQQGLEAAEERKRRAEGLAHEAATKSQQRSKIQSAARQQASRHKEGMRSVRPTLDRSKLRELGEQFKQKLGGSDQGFFNLPESPPVGSTHTRLELPHQLLGFPVQPHCSTDIPQRRSAAAAPDSTVWMVLGR
jgi:hypothetical protein